MGDFGLRNEFLATLPPVVVGQSERGSMTCSDSSKRCELAQGDRMGRVVGILVGGLAALGLVLSGCSSTEQTSTESPAAASSAEFCKQAEDMQTRYLEALQKVASEGKTQDEDALKGLQEQLVQDVKTLEQSLPADASENVRTAFSNVVKNLESGTGQSPSPENQADDATLSAYMAEVCPQLGASPSASASPSLQSASPTQ